MPVTHSPLAASVAASLQRKHRRGRHSLTPMLKLQFKDYSRPPVWVVDKSFTIGSANDNQLIINDSSVDLQHARIIREDQVYSLRDLGSSEGVYVNNQRINKKNITNGDTLRFGTVELTVVDPFVAGNQAYWSLIACSSWLSGQEFVLPKHTRDGTIKVGRSSHCDIIFPGTHLSREHIELRVHADHLSVRDLDSANGTFINDERISEGVLGPGDKLRLDVYNFKIFGPGLGRSAKAQLRTSDSLAKPEPPVAGVSAAFEEAPEKHWKTRPTSPGNRTTETNVVRDNAPLIMVACVLCFAVLGLGLYLFLG